ncbi:hypothetical protein VB715_21465 [Crocosphaera sp. UHCC 0190]|uniref:hypothetical protein n=1 Tax=Crocosphaera sp. UHCC 0190 TaxID=3110246 RepID=UPI002B1EE787|nr:hypothetical protein [Crocosphaera sp. UHCC 0190]MEA5512346.1 hypothetical protein [Crocosphaera sp. UHCC 0190]
MMLTQFRIKYPQGSLISELITINHGKYIVRALVQINGLTLGTGLAADDTIEIAEERAKERALDSLQLDQMLVESSPTVVSPSQQPLTETINAVEIQEKTPEPLQKNNPIEEVEKTPQPSVKTNSKTLPKSTKKAANAAIKSSEIEFIPPKQTPIAAVETVTKPEPEREETVIATSQTIVEFEREETVIATSQTIVEFEREETVIATSQTIVKPEQEEQPLPILETTKASEIEEEALDFSDIIARSNAELKRLKWTTDQGREYLLKTYGKRSRQVLSDEELLEFLHHLESLPTPS